MASGSHDKSLSGGISIPNWMKQKIGDRYDLDDFALSPPPQDDSFFIRYPKTTSRPPSETTYHKINEYLEGQSAVTPNYPTTVSTPGYSTMASGITKALTNQTAASQFQPTSKVPLEFDPNQPNPNLSNRRGSKSLPATPINSPPGSPRMAQRNTSTLHHRYFTAAFPQPKSDSTQSYTGWLLSGLLGPREQSPALGAEMLEPISESPGQLSVPGGENHFVLRKSASTSVLIGKDEEEEKETKTVVVSPVLQEQAKKIKVIKPKPSELREMNFWSPTSM